MSHHDSSLSFDEGKQCLNRIRLTVDGNRNALGKDKAIFALETRNFTQGLDFEVLGGNTFVRLSVYDLKIEVICLRNGVNSNRA